MKIIITGGAGFIGSAVTRHIIKKTNDIVMNIDSLTYAGNLKNLSEVSNSDRYFFKKIDITNQQEINKVFETFKPDAVMHLAAESHVDRSINAPDLFISTNIIGTYKLLEVSKLYWQNLSDKKKLKFRFHHISTDEVYGDLPHPLFNPKAKNFLFTETSNYKPSSPYSASKASSDHLVRAWMRTYGLPVLITNCSNNYGPFQHPEKLIPKMISNILNNKPLTVYGSGNQIRDWLYVEDHAEALYQVITQGVAGETYNIGGYNEVENIEVIKQICDILNKHFCPKDDYLNLIQYIEDRSGHDQRYAIDSAKITSELGWRPNETFETGLKKTVYWYINNLEWFRN